MCVFMIEKKQYSMASTIQTSVLLCQWTDISVQTIWYSWGQNTLIKQSDLLEVHCIDVKTKMKYTMIWNYNIHEQQIGV